jgi:hypothetical protein
LDLSKNIALERADVRMNYLDSEEKVVLAAPANVDLLFTPQKEPQDVTDQFTDPNFLVAIRQTLGKQQDEEIYANECAALTSLNVTNKAITSLAALEYFINLEYLYCSQNNLTQLDISRNPTLKGLICSDNRLTTLNVASNPNLQALDVRLNWMPSESAVVGLNRDITTTFLFSPQAFSGENITDQFTDSIFLAVVRQALDKRANDPIGDQDCASLEYLDVSNNNIESLNGIAYFTSLKMLSCSQNLLTELDLAANSELSYLLCANNQLVSLDISKNTALQMLDCSENQLNSLDLSTNPVLQGLNCTNNHLSALDLSLNPTLRYLLVSKNFFASASAIMGFDSEIADVYAFAPQNPSVITPPTCTEQGYTTWTCGHDTVHTHIDNYVPALGHDWGEWLTRTAATCDTVGLEYHTCSRCPIEETRETAVLGHDFVPTVTPPTYFDAGYTTWVCSHDPTHSYVDSRTEKLTLNLPVALSLIRKTQTTAFSSVDNENINWKSTNENVLKINDKGEIEYQFARIGTTTIQAIDKGSGNVIAQTEVTVKWTWHWILVILLFGWAYL